MADKQEVKEQSKETGRETRMAGGAFRQNLERTGAETAEMAQGVARSGSNTMSEGMRSAGRATQHGMNATGSSVQHGLQTMGDETRHMMEGSAGHFGEIGQKVAEAAQQTAEDLNALLTLPNLATDGLQELQQAVSGLVNRVVQTNLRTTQELFRHSNPAAMVDLQQRCLRQYMQSLLESSTDLLRVSRRLTEDTLKPLERRTRQLSQRNGGYDRQDGNRNGQQEHRGDTVADVMTTDLEVANANQPVQEAARLMARADTGVLPVSDNDRLVGMITDRDIAVRVTAEGRDPSQTSVRDIMTPEVRYVFDDEDLDHVVENMAEQKVRRLPVMNRQKRLIGILSLGDLARKQPPHLAGRALGGIAQGRQQPAQSAYAGDKPADAGKE